MNRRRRRYLAAVGTLIFDIAAITTATEMADRGHVLKIDVSHRGLMTAGRLKSRLEFKTVNN